ncbi:MAG: PD40 domain-containing protein [Sedimentisphaerales bacterium]|nr:PD40 domain-containing protein [Sedimentisphaerales bacterium]
MKWCYHIAGKLSLSVVCCLVVGTGGPALAEVIGQPVLLAAPIYTQFPELSPCISKDGLSLYFASYRPEGAGESDLYVATRASVGAPWDTVQNLGLRVNTTASEWGPCISADNLTLYFSSDRADGYGGQDLWFTTRDSVESEWLPATNVGSPVNSVYDEVEPSISVDHCTLCFSDGVNAVRPGGLQSWSAERATPEQPWGQPESLDAQIDVGLEVTPCISADGLTLLYAGASGFNGPWSLYAARRTAKSEAFGSPVELTFNSPHVIENAVMPSLSADGKTLYFATGDVQTGESWNLWEASLAPIVDFNGDGKVDSLELKRMFEHWGTDDLRYDIAPMPAGNGLVDAGDVTLLAQYEGTNPIGDPTLMGYWKLDCNPGDEPGKACDSSANCCHGILAGDACLVADGVINGALQCDGYCDYVEMPVWWCNPGDGELSVSAWVMGSRPGKVILSQRSGANWLMADPVTGALKTELRSDARFTSTLQCYDCICDGDWHHVGLVWDGENRSLYVDGEKVAEDTQLGLAACSGTLLLGGCSELNPGRFWAGLIDEVRVYHRAVEP